MSRSGAPYPCITAISPDLPITTTSSPPPRRQRHRLAQPGIAPEAAVQADERPQVRRCPAWKCAHPIQPLPNTRPIPYLNPCPTPPTPVRPLSDPVRPLPPPTPVRPLPPPTPPPQAVAVPDPKHRHHTDLMLARKAAAPAAMGGGAPAPAPAAALSEGAAGDTPGGDRPSRGVKVGALAHITYLTHTARPYNIPGPHRSPI